MHRFNKLMIDVTSRCNLDCPVCYHKKNISDDPPLARLQSIASQYSGKIILLCGGEPTLRDDLPEIIELFSRANTVFLVTNGIRLSDIDYLRRLQGSGLRYISFSFNGFTDAVYEKINGKPLLDIKRAALRNLKHLRIKTVLSVLIARGINEDQIPAIVDYYADNRDFIEEVRIRSMAPVGSYVNSAQYSVTELIDAVCDALHIEKDGLLKEFELKRRLNTFLKRDVFVLRNCSFDFHLKKCNNKFIPAGNRIADQSSERYVLPLDLIRVFGIPMIISGFLKIFLGLEAIPWVHNDRYLKIGLRSWPDKNGIDSKCMTGYYLNGEIVPFCYANSLHHIPLPPAESRNAP